MAFGQQIKIGKPCNRPFTEIGIINQLAETFLRRVLPKPLTIAQFHVLTHLTRLPGPHTPTAITNAFQVTKGAMTHTLGLLSKNGWVSIEADLNDGRSKQVEITPEGAEIFQTTVTKLGPYFDRNVHRLPRRGNRSAHKDPDKNPCIHG